MTGGHIYISIGVIIVGVDNGHTERLPVVVCCGTPASHGGDSIGDGAGLYVRCSREESRSDVYPASLRAHLCLPERDIHQPE